MKITVIWEEWPEFDCGRAKTDGEQITCPLLGLLQPTSSHSLSLQPVFPLYNIHIFFVQSSIFACITQELNSKMSLDHHVVWLKRSNSAFENISQCIIVSITTPTLRYVKEFFIEHIIILKINKMSVERRTESILFWKIILSIQPYRDCPLLLLLINLECPMSMSYSRLARWRWSVKPKQKAWTLYSKKEDSRTWRLINVLGWVDETGLLQVHTSPKFICIPRAGWGILSPSACRLSVGLRSCSLGWASSYSSSRST